MAKDNIRVTFLGGLGEIGRNCLALEQDGRIVVVDAGLMFPEPTMYGVDIILPVVWGRPVLRHKYDHRFCIYIFCILPFSCL